MKRKIIIFIILTSLMALPYLTLGQSQSPFVGGGPTPIAGGSGGGSGRIDNPLGNGTNDIYAFIAKVLDAVSELGAVVVVFFIIYSGFLFVTAQGNEEKLKKAKNALLWTLVGAAILLGARALSDAIKNTITQLQQ